MKKVVCLILSLMLLGVTSPSVVAAETIYNSLKLITPIPQTIASNTIAVDLQPTSYPSDYNLQPLNFPSEYKYTETTVSVCDSDKFCGNSALGQRVGKLNVNGDYRASRIYVLQVNANRIIFSFDKAGKYYVNITKHFGREVRPLNRDFWGNVSTEWMYEKILIPIEITDVSKGGIDIKDLNAAGVDLFPIPILKCPEKIKNTKQTISCNLGYAYDTYERDYVIVGEPFESFKVCAYKVEENFSGCGDKPSPYFSRDIKIDKNTSSSIKIPISKDVDTAIYFQWENNNVPDFKKGKAAFKYYFNKPIKYAPTKKSNPSNGKWVKKCKMITTKEVLRPGELTDMVLNGGGGPRTYKTEVCEDVWVP
jgi:hypothetical protein